MKRKHWINLGIFASALMFCIGGLGYAASFVAPTLLTLPGLLCTGVVCGLLASIYKEALFGRRDAKTVVNDKKINIVYVKIQGLLELIGLKKPYRLDPEQLEIKVANDFTQLNDNKQRYEKELIRVQGQMNAVYQNRFGTADQYAYFEREQDGLFQQLGQIHRAAKDEAGKMVRKECQLPGNAKYYDADKTRAYLAATAR